MVGKRQNGFPQFIGQDVGGDGLPALVVGRARAGLQRRAVLQLYDLVESNAPILSKELKKLGNYRKGGVKGFDTTMNRLQSRCYVLISDFVYMKDKFGEPYGWGVAEYSTPEAFMGERFTDAVYRRTPEESYERLLEHFSKLFPHTDIRTIKKFLK